MSETRNLSIPAIVTLSIPGVGVMTFDSSTVNDEILLTALLHGMKQKLCDPFGTAKAADPVTRRAIVNEGIVKFQSGVWNAKKGKAAESDFEKWLSKIASITAQAWVKQTSPNLGKEAMVLAVVERQKFYLTNVTWTEKQKAKYVPPAELDLEP